MSKISKGDILHGPDGMGYIVQRDIQSPEALLAADLKPFGGAPKPVPGGMVPGWIGDAFDALKRQSPRTTP